MTTTTKTRGTATIADLYRTEGKAELIGGRIVRYMATGHEPNRVAGEIFAEIRTYVKSVGKGEAIKVYLIMVDAAGSSTSQTAFDPWFAPGVG